VLSLINVWLCNRSFYTCSNGKNSNIYDPLLGTIKESIQGPMLYAIFMSPIVNIERLWASADDSIIPRGGRRLQSKIMEMEDSLAEITKW
jgi:hypothetical protein